jgi:hypothetical protein
VGGVRYCGDQFNETGSDEDQELFRQLRHELGRQSAKVANEAHRESSCMWERSMDRLFLSGPCCGRRPLLRRSVLRLPGQWLYAADHVPVLTEFDIQCPEAPSRTTTNWREADWGPRLGSEYFQPLIPIGLPPVRGRPGGRFGALDVDLHTRAWCMVTMLRPHWTWHGRRDP